MPAETLDSEIVGENDGPNVDIGFDKWTSDHRGVVSTFEVTPAAMPETVALDRRMLTEGDDFTVYVNAPDEAAASVAIVAEGDDASAAVESQPLDHPSGSLSFTTEALPPAGYDVLMLGEDGSELARNQLWVRPKNAGVQLSTDQTTYAVGDPVEVTWDQGPANRWDWIAVYKAGADDPDKDDYLLWGYTGGHDSGALPPTVDGTMSLDDSAQGKPWPLPPGKYVVHYLLTDQYESAGTTTFTVSG